jgi:release factor glutamine methyltransferase
MLAASMLRENVAGASVLDLCTGSGLLALTASEHGAARVVAVDVSRRALLSVRLNARLNGVKIEALHGDIFEPVAGQRFDLIVSNPPYVPSDRPPSRGPARAWEAGPDGRLFLDRICAEVARHLNPGGVFLLVHSEVCDGRRTAAALRDQGLEVRVVARHRGPLGPRLRSRAGWLRAQGLLADPGQEELVAIRGQLPVHAAHQVRERHLLG